MPDVRRHARQEADWNTVWTRSFSWYTEISWRSERRSRSSVLVSCNRRNSAAISAGERPDG